jgi:hypothetical protein
VVEEAEEAKERGILVPVFLDAVRPPRGFRSIQAADLSSWQQGKSSPSITSFLTAVAKFLGKEGRAAKDTPLLLPNASGIRSRGADRADACPGPADTIGVQRPFSLSGRRLILGGLGAIALLGAGAFLAWPNLRVPIGGDNRPVSDKSNTDQQIGDVSIRIVSVKRSRDKDAPFIELQYSVMTGSNFSWHNPLEFVRLASNKAVLSPIWTSVQARLLSPNSRQDVLVRFPYLPEGVPIVFRFGNEHHLDLPARVTH